MRLKAFPRVVARKRIQSLDLLLARILHLEPADVGFAESFLSMPTESPAGKHEAPLKWSTLIAAMAFSVRIVAVSGMQNILDGKSPPGLDLYELTARVLSRSL
ncbi:hypothetical protein ACLOJK_001815 [Asimina triloba]